MEEILEAFDESGKFIGLFSRAECHRRRELAHRAVHILVFNSSGSIILQRRSAKKDLYKLMWDTSVGGHLAPGESYLDGAIRECKEELGITPKELIELYSYTMYAENETELVLTYFTIHDGPYHPDSEEVLELKSFSVSELFGKELEKVASPFFLKEREEFEKFLKRSGFYESDDNRWRRDVWQRFVSFLKERKD